MDQNTTQGGTQQGGQQFSNPFGDTSAQGQSTGQGFTPPTDDAAVTPPWLSFSPTGGAAQDDTATNPFAANPFTDQTVPPIAEQPAYTPPQDTTYAAPVNPWETPATEAPTAPAANPWDTGVVEPITTAETPWEAPAVEEAPVAPWMPAEETTEEETPEEDTSSSFTDNTTAKKSSDDLLAELKRRFEEEEGEVDAEIQVHENNIKMEQAAIRELKASRKEQVERMKGMFQELKMILKIDKEEAAAHQQNKPRPPQPQQVAPKPHHPRPQQPLPQKEKAPMHRPPQQAA